MDHPPHLGTTGIGPTAPTGPALKISSAKARIGREQNSGSQRPDSSSPMTLESAWLRNTHRIQRVDVFMALPDVSFMKGYLSNELHYT